MPKVTAIVNEEFEFELRESEGLSSILKCASLCSKDPNEVIKNLEKINNVHVNRDASQTEEMKFRILVGDLPERSISGTSSASQLAPSSLQISNS